MGRPRRILATVAVAAAMTVTGCGSSTTAATSTSVAMQQVTTTQATTPETSTTLSEALPEGYNWNAVEEVATAFMVARGARDLEAALAVLDDPVFFDWGPIDGRDGLAAAWEWEDAFTIVHILQGCEAQTTLETPTARCWLLVNSEVAEVAGNEPQAVCVDVTVEERLVTRVIGIEPQPSCPYDYWQGMFAPFAEWLETTHPDTTVQLMYDDRVSAAGLELWRTYTAEYLADNDS